MRPLSASQLLDNWERGLSRHPIQCALSLLETARPDASAHDLACLSIGRRNDLLLTLREWTFGPHIAGVVTCSICHQNLEVDFSIPEIRVADKSELSEAGAEGVERLSLSAEGYEVEFRLPNSLDMMDISSYSDVEAARRALLENCVLSALRNDAELPAEALPETIVSMIAERMEQADPQADVELSLSCPVCGHEWQAAFDIVSYFWSEINDWAHRILRDVHALASAYGWREADILALSPGRRGLYLEMI